MTEDETAGRLWRHGAVLAFAGMTAIAVDVHAQDAERGRQLYENHCQVCHTAQVHGRKQSTTFSIDDLREIVRRWQENQGLRWSREEIDDVTQYLARSKYNFSTSIEGTLRGMRRGATDQLPLARRVSS